MEVSIYDFIKFSEIKPEKQMDIGFVGNAIDNRGREAVALTSDMCNKLVEIYYDAENLEIHVGKDKKLPVDDFEGFFIENYKSHSIFLEATTLGFVEILLLVNSFYRNSNISELLISYFEPKGYKKQPADQELLHSRDFELSIEFQGFIGIPGFLPMFLDDPDQSYQLIFSLGYEASRLERVFEELQIVNHSDLKLIFGIPAFEPGWEMNSIINHLEVISNRNLINKHKFTGASNPKAVYDYLNKVKQANPTEEIIIAPIGTKPISIGMILFLVENEGVRILYDHPVRGKDRSKDVAKKYVYKILKNE